MGANCGIESSKMFSSPKLAMDDAKRRASPPVPQGIAEAKRYRPCTNGTAFMGMLERIGLENGSVRFGPTYSPDEVKEFVSLQDYESALQCLALMESQLPQWQAIETAPKDGTMISVIDITRKLPTQFTAYWSEWENETGWLEPRSDIIFNATHWMPLMPIPVPPIEGQVR